MSKSTESISKGIDVSTKNPVLFAPSLVPIAVHLVFLVLAYIVFPYRGLGWDWFRGGLYEITVPNPYLVWGGMFIAFILGFIAECVTVDLANDVLQKQQPNLNKSISAVTSNLGVLIVVALIAAVCAITVILIPLAFFIITIAIVEKLDAVESIKKALDFVITNIGEAIIFLIIVIVIDVIFTFVFTMIPIVGPYLGTVIQWILNVIFTTSAVCFYLALKQTATAPPPPPTAASTTSVR
jgi:magnesium-transporting ATPase (P-type)